MPKWLKGMVVPTLMLWLCAVAWGVACSVAPGRHAPKGSGVASGYALPLVLALWVTADARKRGKQLFYDYDSFVFFAWPVIVPVYSWLSPGVFGCDLAALGAFAAQRPAAAESRPWT
jgi:hypothetical protein